MTLEAAPVPEEMVGGLVLKPPGGEMQLMQAASLFKGCASLWREGLPGTAFFLHIQVPAKNGLLNVSYSMEVYQ